MAQSQQNPFPCDMSPVNSLLKNGYFNNGFKLVHLNNDFKLVAGVAFIYAIFHIVEISSADCSNLLGYHGEIMSHVEGL